MAMNLRFLSSTGSSTEMKGTSLYIWALRSATVACPARTLTISNCAVDKKSGSALSMAKTPTRPVSSAKGVT